VELLEALKAIHTSQGLLSWLDVFNAWAQARAAGPEGAFVQATAEAALDRLEEAQDQPSYEAMRLLARAILGWWSLAVDALALGEEAAGLRVRALHLARQLDEVTEGRWALATWLETHTPRPR